MGEIGIKEIILIAIVTLLLFGTKRLPELMKGLGKGMKTFNDGKQSIMDEVDNIKSPVSSAKKNMTKSFKSSISDLDSEPVKEKKD